MSSTSGVTVEVVTEMTDEVLASMSALLPQLSSSATGIEPEALRKVIEAEACHLLISRDLDGSILGSMTLVVFPIPTGIRAWIEDVVVDESARGKGVGAALNSHALELAYSLGARTVDLTSRPSREAANRLYQRLGFEERSTNVYRHNPDAS